MGRPARSNPPACSHCGDPCLEPGLVQVEGPVFCCTGCQTVYQLLHEKGLDAFYKIDQAAGRSQKATPTDNFDWLEIEELAEQFIQYQDEDRIRVRLALPTIHCSSCIWLLENLPQINLGIHAVVVNFGKRTAEIVFSPEQLPFPDLARLLSKIGYPPDFKATTQTEKTPKNRRLLYQIGLAGFTFGNIMLFSFPAYFGLKDAGEDALFHHTFQYLSLALCIPLLLFSGRDYLKAAVRAIAHRELTMDVPISIGMLALFFRSSYEVLAQTGHGYFDSLAGFLFFLLLGRWFQDQTFRQLSFDRDYRSYFPLASRKINPTGDSTPVALADIRPGDRLLIKAGELIPADSKLLTPARGGIDYSFVTGETTPQVFEVGARVFAGGSPLGTALEVVVEKTVEQSYLLQLWRENPGQRAQKVRNQTDRASQLFTLVILGVAFITLGVWWSHSIDTAMNAFTAVLIIACPCALALAIPFTYGTLQKRLGSLGFYLRDLGVVERLQTVDEIVFDKTGTLTKPGLFKLHQTWGDLTAEQSATARAMVQRSPHPVSSALEKLFISQSPGAVVLDNYQEFPGDGIAASYQGHHYRIGRPRFCSDRPQVGTLAHETCLSIDGVIKARFAHHKTQLRPGIPQVLRQLRAANINLHLISGDKEGNRSNWEGHLEKSQIRFQQSPFDKQAYIKDLQGRGQKVTMIGDGLNDSGALQVADVGIAVGEDFATFTPASDAIIVGSSLPKLAHFLRIIKRSRFVLYTAYLLSITYNLVGLGFAVQGQLSPLVAAILMPISSLSIVFVGVFGVYLLTGKPDQSSAA